MSRAVLMSTAVLMSKASRSRWRTSVPTTRRSPPRSAWSCRTTSRRPGPARAAAGTTANPGVEGALTGPVRARTTTITTTRQPARTRPSTARSPLQGPPYGAPAHHAPGASAPGRGLRLDHGADAVLVLQEHEDAGEEVAHQVLRTEADGDAGDGCPRDQWGQLDVQLAEGGEEGQHPDDDRRHRPQQGGDRLGPLRPAQTKGLVVGRG